MGDEFNFDFDGMFPSSAADPSAGLDFSNMGDFGSEGSSDLFPVSDIDVPVYTDTPNLPPIAPGESTSSSWDFTNIASGLQNVFKAALELNNVYKSLNKPAVRTSSATTTANANGTLTTITGTGGTVTARMPVGTPYLTASGVMVMNNGNGTYTITNPDGSTVTRAYSNSTGVGLPSWALPAGLAAAAFFLLPKRR